MTFRGLLATVCFCLLSIVLPQQIAYSQNTVSNSASASVPLSASLVIDGREAEEIWINTGQGRFRFTAEIADEEAERSSGLMFREKMAPTHGMLFDFGQKRQIQMWMRNTPLPLDMVFIDEKGRVVGIAERTTPFSDAIIDSGVPVSFVLEVNAGISRLLGMKPGDTIEHRLFIKE
jgi:uncharacterized protein